MIPTLLLLALTTLQADFRNLDDRHLTHSPGLEKLCATHSVGPKEKCGAVHRTSDGGITEVNGPWTIPGNAALDAASTLSLLKSALSGAAQTTMPPAYGLDVVFVDDVDESTTIIALKQSYSAIPYFDAELRGVVIDGNLISINGRARLSPHAQEPAVDAVIDPLEIVENEIGVDQILYVESIGPNEIAITTVGDGQVTAALGFNSDGDLEWRISDDAKTLRVDAFTGEFLGEISHWQHSPGNEYADIRRWEIGDHPDEWEQTVSSIDDRRAYWYTLGATRRFFLGYRNVDYPVQQVFDGNGSEVWTEAVPGVKALFGSSNFENLEEQSYFFWVSVVRDYFAQYIFPSVVPDHRRAITGLFMDMNPWTYCNACYNPWTEAIYLSDLGTGGRHSAGTLWHEYGHAIADMYGGYGTYCNQNVDESRALSETFAHVVAFAMGRRYAGMNYSSVWPRVANSTKHFNLGTLIKHGDNTCTGGSYYDVGLGFEQAIWELLNNFDCSSSNCSGGTWGSDIGWSNTGAARFGVLRSLVYAKRVLPSNTTFKSTASWMFSYWKSKYSVSIANAADDVMQHHGY